MILSEHDNSASSSPSSFPIDTFLSLLADRRASLEEAAARFALPLTELARIAQDSAAAHASIEARRTLAELRALLISIDALPRAAALFVDILDDESANIETRRKAAAAIVRMCHASPKDKHAPRHPRSSSAHPESRRRTSTHRATHRADGEIHDTSPLPSPSKSPAAERPIRDSAPQSDSAQAPDQSDEQVAACPPVPNSGPLPCNCHICAPHQTNSSAAIAPGHRAHTIESTDEQPRAA